MRVSVIMPCYNASKFVEDAIASFILQSYPAKELVIVDGGSSDGTREILRRNREMIDVLVLEHDDGPADAFNKGVVVSSGALVVSLNADDLLMPGALEAAAEAAHAFPDAAIIQGKSLIIDHESQPVGLALPDPFRLVYFLYGAARIVHPGSTIRRSWFDRVGGFNTDNRTCWDGELFVDVAAAGGPIVSVPKWLSCYRVHPLAISSSAKFHRDVGADRRRIFARVRGRPWRWYDSIIALGLRVLSLLRAPAHITRRSRFVVHRVAARYANWLRRVSSYC